jgi:hypothetical protein
MSEQRINLVTMRRNLEHMIERPAEYHVDGPYGARTLLALVHAAIAANAFQQKIPMQPCPENDELWWRLNGFFDFGEPTP